MKILNNDVGDVTECTLSKLTENKKLGEVADTPQDCVAIQKNLDNLEKWVERNVMKFSKGKCKFLRQRKNKFMYQYRLESSSAEKYLGILVGKKLRQQCAIVAKAANSLLGCNRKSMPAG